MSQDYYDILNIGRQSSAEEIKTAYRKLAMKHHPDRNQGKADSEEAFKKINEAYTVLSDPQKRQQYDQVGHANYANMGQDNHASHGNGDFGDIFSAFSDIFGGSHKQQQSGSDLLYKLDLTLEEVLTGTVREIQFHHDVACDACQGNGADPGHKPKQCHSCRGSGSINISQGFLAMKHSCPTCQGRGKIITVACKQCRAQGIVSKQCTLSINIPKGVDNNVRLCVSGEGNGIATGRPGDLFIEIHIKPHSIFKRQTLDLYTDIPIPFSTAVFGGDVKIVGINGHTYSLSIPPETQSNSVFRMRHKGVETDKGQKGDMLIKVIVETPVKLNNEQKAALKYFDQMMTNNEIYPKQSTWLHQIEQFIARIKG